MLGSIWKELLSNIKSYRWIIIGIVLYFSYFALFHPGEPNCLVKQTIGIPCPGCGMSRAFIYFISFQWSLAFYYHPLIFLMPLITIVLLFKGLPHISTLYHSKLFWIFIGFLFVVVYIIRMILNFPDIEPMDYYPQSLISRFLQ